MTHRDCKCVDNRGVTKGTYTDNIFSALGFAATAYCYSAATYYRRDIKLPNAKRRRPQFMKLVEQKKRCGVMQPCVKGTSSHRPCVQKAPLGRRVTGRSTRIHVHKHRQEGRASPRTNTQGGELIWVPTENPPFPHPVSIDASDSRCRVSARQAHTALGGFAVFH